MSCKAARVRVEGLSKSYQVYQKPQHRLLQSLLRGRKQFYTEFWALRDVSVTVAAGETLGILGRNGSGKSTLLQIVAGTVRPTRGRVELDGRVAAILELGAGFNPEFTGRENVELATSVYGMKASEVAARMDDILRFADIGEFIDRPVKTYSSGMYARLAFSVAIHVDPDVLIVDEALAVGDAKFQAQCFRKFDEFRKRGVTILFVTHSVDQILRHCSRAMLLEHGRNVMTGEPKAVVAQYLELLFGTPGGAAVTMQTEAPRPAPLVAKGAFADDGAPNEDRFAGRTGYNRLEHRWGDGRARIVDFALLDETGKRVTALTTGDRASLHVKVQFLADIARPIYGLAIRTPDGVEIAAANSRESVRIPSDDPRAPGEVAVVRFDFKCLLNGGDYLLSVGVAEGSDGAVIPLDRRYDAIHIQVVNTRKVFGLVDLEIQPVSVEEISA
ncbi:MAG TPA: ABC transporter ATP-binding protein [Casimicrobiaceae bacterium]